MSEHPWPTEERIAEVNEEAMRRGSFDRDWSKFDFSECKHSLMVGDERDGWRVMLCPNCGHTTSHCAHSAFEWNEAGTLLRCTTCGIDGT